MKQTNQQNPAQTKEATTTEKTMPLIELTVSVDKMAAYIKVKPAFEGQEIIPEDILAFLKKRDITYGIKKDAINSFCTQKRFFSELTCAQGVPPIHQEAGTLAFEFDTQSDTKPKEREDGTMDFRDLGLVQNVAKGTVLCRIQMPPDGHDGIDIYDHVVPHRQAKMPAFPSGKNTEVSEDGLTLVSSIDGCVEFRNHLVNVEDVFTVKGDVDTSSGNIDFTGSVNVRGDVREGFSIKAGGDIFITGMAEGASVKSGGSVAISKGMNGMLKGILCAANDVTGKYFENTTIECGGNLYADVLLNCNVKVGGSVILKGKKSLLIGGTCTAGQMIYTSTIGSGNNIHTNVVISSPLLNKALAGNENSSDDHEINDLKTNLGSVKQTIAELQKQIQLFAAKPNKTDKERALIKLLLGKKAQNAAQMSVLEKTITQKETAIEESKKSTTDFKVVATSRIFPGVKLTIGPFTQTLEAEYSNTKIYADAQNIMFLPVSPADKMDSF